MPGLEIELDERSYEELQNLATTRGRSLSGTVRDILQSALRVKEEPSVYKQFDHHPLPQERKEWDDICIDIIVIQTRGASHNENRCPR